MSESEEVTSSFHPNENLLATLSRSFIEARLRIDKNVLYDNQCQYVLSSNLMFVWLTAVLTGGAEELAGELLTYYR